MAEGHLYGIVISCIAHRLIFGSPRYGDECRVESPFDTGPERVAGFFGAIGHSHSVTALFTSPTLKKVLKFTLFQEQVTNLTLLLVSRYSLRPNSLRTRQCLLYPSK